MTSPNKTSKSGRKRKNSAGDLQFEELARADGGLNHERSMTPERLNQTSKSKKKNNKEASPGNSN